MSENAQSYLRRVVQEVTLPSGAVFKIKKPNGFWFASHASILPIIATKSDTSEATSEDIEKGAELNRLLIIDHVLEPKIGPVTSFETDTIGVDDLLRTDADFLTNYLWGRQDADGRSLETFPGDGVATVPGTDSGNIQMSAQ